MSDVRDFIKEWKPKKIKEWKKDQRHNLILQSLESIINFYLREAHNPKSKETLTELYSRLATPIFAKSLVQLLKLDDKPQIDLAIVAVINGFLESGYMNIDKEAANADEQTALRDELLEYYNIFVSKLLKKRTKFVASETGLNEDFIKELLVIVPHPGIIKNDKYIGVHVNNIMRKIYLLSKDNDLGLDSFKKYKKLFTEIFGKENLQFVAIAILLERKSIIRNFNEAQTAIWNQLTEFALTVIEDNKKKDIRDLIVDRFIALRLKEEERGRDSARRIQFSSVAEKAYPKIHEVYTDLNEKEKMRKFL